MSSPLSIIASLLLLTALAYLATNAALTVTAALRRGGRQEDPAAGRDTLAASRFTIPVSVIVPVREGGPSPSRVIRDLLGLAYPEFEIIVVAEGMPSATLEALGREWKIEPKEFFYRRVLKAADVRRIFRGSDESRLLIVDKMPAGTGISEAQAFADAVNCGSNLARYRYITALSPDITFAPDALLRAMAPALRDPAQVVAVINHVERRAPEAPTSGDTPGGPASRWEALVAGFQQMASLRAIMESRILADRKLRGPCAHDAVVVWRRDAFQAAGGLQAGVADPHVDLLGRLTLAEDETLHVVRSGEIFGYAPALPSRMALRAVSRRQESTLSVLKDAGVRLLDQGAPDDARGASLRSLLSTEVLRPAAHLVVASVTLVGTAVRWLTPVEAAAVFVLLSLITATVTSAALLVRAASPGRPDRLQVRTLILTAPLELLTYGTLLASARIRGAWSSVVRDLLRPSPTAS